MPVITDPPVLVDPLRYARSFVGFDNFGPFELNGALYLVQSDSQALTPPYYATVYKSTDGGATWTVPDAANRGRTVNSHLVFGSVFVVGNVITLFFEANAGGGPSQVQWVTFDAATDSYGPVNNISFLYADLAQNVFYARPRSNGNILFFYVDVSGTAAYSEFDGASWSASTAVGTNTTGSRADGYGLHITADDTAHFIWGDPFGTLASSYRSLSAANALGAIVPVDPFGASLASRYSNTWTEFGGKFYLTCKYTLAGSARICLFQSDSLTPSAWTLLDPTASAEISTNDSQAVLSGGLYYIFYIQTLYNGGFSVVLQDQIRYLTTADFVTFSAAVVYYDNLTDPPVPNPTTPASQFIHTLAVAALAAGGFGLATALEYETVDTTYCAGYYLGAGAPTPPATPNIPPGGVASGFTGFAPCAPAARARRTYRPWIPPARRKPCS